MTRNGRTTNECECGNLKPTLSIVGPQPYLQRRARQRTRMFTPEQNEGFGTGYKTGYTSEIVEYRRASRGGPMILSPAAIKWGKAPPRRMFRHSRLVSRIRFSEDSLQRLNHCLRLLAYLPPKANSYSRQNLVWQRTDWDCFYRFAGVYSSIKTEED